MEKIDKIKNSFIDLLKLCKFDTLLGDFNLSWFDKKNITVNGNCISIDFILDDDKQTYGYLYYNFVKDEFCLTIEHHKGTIIKDNLFEFSTLHNYINSL